MSKLLSTIMNSLTIELARITNLVLPSKQNIWVFGESELQAQENGYLLYLWVKKNAPHIEAYYVISKKSPLAGKLISDPNIIWLNSFRQVLKLFQATRIISTHGLWMIPNGLGIQKKILRRRLPAKRIMLNHGMCFLKNGRKFYHKSIFPLNDRVIALSKAHKAIFTEEYGYDDKDVVIAGYPRFDYMIDCSEQSKYNNLIIFMPTFRDNEQKIGDDFLKTEMYKQIESIVSDNTFHEMIESNNITFGIYLHQNIQEYSCYLEKFSNKRIKIFRQGQYSVTELLRMSKILVTDYSSVMFDFCYMKKPFISFQFDYDTFISSREEGPLINIQTDLPGVVVRNKNQLINEIRKIIENNYNPEEKYIKMTSKFFQYQDQKNCRRVFDSIEKM